MPRVAVEVVVEAPFGPLRVMTTHLEYYSKEHRAAQIARLRELHREAVRARTSRSTSRAATNRIREARARWSAATST